MRSFLLIPLIMLAVGCVDPDCGKVISLSPGANGDGGGQCAELVNGVYDYSDCCPNGYDFLAVGSDGGVLCEEECGLGSTAAVDRAGKAAFLTHAVADAAFEAVEDLASGP